MTTRDNSARFGTPDVTSLPSNLDQQPEQAKINNLEAAAAALQYVVPVELVELPTKGLFYPEGHPLHNKQEIEIKSMTAKEEDLLVNKSLLKKGIALDRVLQSVIVDKSIRLEDLFVGDKNAIIVATRTMAYGSEYNTNVSCPECMAGQKYKFDLEDKTISYLDEIEEDEVEVTDRGTLIFTLPKTRATVEAKLLNGHDEASLFGRGQNKKKELSLTDQFKAYVVSVNNVTDKNLINQFIDVMPAYDSKFLRETYSKVIPNIDLTQHFECSNCGHSQEMEVPFTVEFFWPRS